VNGINSCLTSLTYVEPQGHLVHADVMFPMNIYPHRLEEPVYLDLLVRLDPLVFPVTLVHQVQLVVRAPMVLLV